MINFEFKDGDLVKIKEKHWPSCHNVLHDKDGRRHELKENPTFIVMRIVDDHLHLQIYCRGSEEFVYNKSYFEHVNASSKKQSKDCVCNIKNLLSSGHDKGCYWRK